MKSLFIVCFLIGGVSIPEPGMGASFIHKDSRSPTKAVVERTKWCMLTAYKDYSLYRYVLTDDECQTVKLYLDGRDDDAMAERFQWPLVELMTEKNEYMGGIPASVFYDDVSSGAATRAKIIAIMQKAIPGQANKAVPPVPFPTLSMLEDVYTQTRWVMLEIVTPDLKTFRYVLDEEEGLIIKDVVREMNTGKSKNSLSLERFRISIECIDAENRVVFLLTADDLIKRKNGVFDEATLILPEETSQRFAMLIEHYLELLPVQPVDENNFSKGHAL